MESAKNVPHKFDLSKNKPGDKFLGCDKCWFRHEPGTVGVPQCPKCGGILSIFDVTAEDFPISLRSAAHPTNSLEFPPLVFSAESLEKIEVELPYQRPPNSQECKHGAYRLQNGYTDIIINHSDDIEFLEIGGDDAERTQIYIEGGNGFVANVDLEDILRFAKKYCAGIYERVGKE